MINATPSLAMPATNCPAWCTRDHVADWAEQCAHIGQSYELPMLDGTVARGTFTPENTLRRWEPWHTHELLGRGRWSLLVVEEDGKPALMLGDEVTTPEHLRELAKGLASALEEFEALS